MNNENQNIEYKRIWQDDNLKSICAFANAQGGVMYIIEILKAKYLYSPIHYRGLQRIEPLEIPEDSLREAIFNAIIHKDYMRGADFFPRRLY